MARAGNRGGEETHPETRARANFNNGDFQAVINEFAEYVLLEMIMERTGKSRGDIRRGMERRDE